MKNLEIQNWFLVVGVFSVSPPLPPFNGRFYLSYHQLQKRILAKGAFRSTGHRRNYMNSEST